MAGKRRSSGPRLTIAADGACSTVAAAMADEAAGSPERPAGGSASR